MKRLFLLLAVCLMGIGLGYAHDIKLYYDKGSSDIGTPDLYLWLRVNDNNPNNSGWDSTNYSMSPVSGTTSVYSFETDNWNWNPNFVIFRNSGHNKQSEDISYTYGHLYKFNGINSSNQHYLVKDMGLYGAWEVFFSDNNETSGWNDSRNTGLNRDAGTNISTLTVKNRQLTNGQYISFYNEVDGKRFNLGTSGNTEVSGNVSGKTLTTNTNAIKWTGDTGNYDIAIKIYPNDNGEMLLDMSFTPVVEITPGADDWKINIDGTDYSLTWNADNSAYEWASSKPLTLKSITNNWTATSSSKIYFHKGTDMYNYNDGGNNYWLKENVVDTELKKTDKHMLFVWGNNQTASITADYNVTVSVKHDGEGYKASMSFVQKAVKPSLEWGIHINGIDDSWTYATSTKYSWDADQNAYVLDQDLNGEIVKEAEFAWYTDSNKKYNLYATWDNAFSRFWLGSEGCTGVELTSDNTQSGYFNQDTGRYHITSKIYQKNDKWMADVKFTKISETPENYYTIYFVMNKDALKGLGLSETDNPYEKVAIYQYSNGEDATQATNNGNWPGNNKIFTKAPENIQELVPGDYPVYEAKMRTDLLRFIINDNKTNGAKQSANLLVVDQGVYFWNDELLPFGALLSDNSGKTVYRRYDNIADHMPTRYIYIPASEFSEKDAEGNVTTEYTGDLYVYCNADGVDKAGLRGTTKMIREVYNGVAYYKVPTASIADGTMMTFEVNANGDTDNNNWKNVCGDATHADDNHIGCSDTHRIMKFTVEVEFMENRVYYREGADGTIRYGDILEETSPSKITLVYDGVEQKLTRTESSTYYWNGKFTAGKEFYYDVEFKNGGTGRIVPDVAKEQTYRLTPYDITVSDRESSNRWIAPQAEFTYQVRLNWGTQQTWTVPNSEKPFITTDIAPMTIDAKSYDETGSEGHKDNVEYRMHQYFNDADAYFAKTTVSFVAADAELKASKYNRGAHHDASMQQGNAYDDHNEGTVGVTPHTAGVYNLMVISPASVEFDRQVATSTVTVLPTIESVGVTINYQPVVKDESGDGYTVKYDTDYDAEENKFTVDEFTYDNSFAFVEIGEEMIKHLSNFGTMEAAEKNAARNEAAQQHNIRYFFKYVTPKTDKAADADAKFAPRRAALQAAPEGYTEVYGKNGIDLKYAKDNGGFNLIVEENGQRSKEKLVKVDPNVLTEVDSIEAEETEYIYYDLQGNRIENPERGLYIRVSNGKADKIAL